LTVGSCAGAASGPGRAADVGASSGDTNAGAGVACVGGDASNGGTTLVARIGSCEDGATGGVGGLGGFGGGSDLAGTLGTSGAGDDGSGFATLASAQLPFTGLPLWTAGLAGFATILLGLALWRRSRGELTEPV
jgi:hypothetical protein